jgi:prophage regulatory protein
MATSPEHKPRLVAFAELKERGVLLGRRQVDRLEAMNKFPKRVPLSEARVAWVTEEIDQWVAERIAARSTDIGMLGAGPGKGVKRAVRGGKK